MELQAANMITTLKTPRDAVYNTVDALDNIIDARKGSYAKRSASESEDTSTEREANDLLDNQHGIGNLASYCRKREDLVGREGALAFDWLCTQNASEYEIEADRIFQVLKHNDRVNIYDTEPRRVGYDGQKHPRFPGDHFLGNRPIIDRTDLFKITQKMPKGAHLHIHFNACLPPETLINIAKKIDRMFITSDLPLLGHDNFINYKMCEIQFSILSPEKERPGNLFEESYQQGERRTMKFQDFIRDFPHHFTECSVDEWLSRKLEFQEEETHNSLQTWRG